MSPLQQFRAALSPEQIRLYKILFVIISALAVMDAWIWYLLWERNNLFFIPFVFGYFYFCNIVTNIRTVIMWPFYFGSGESD